ncbi:hypothetical protein U1Q18_043252 [Sarracenia purpurea var. burkii]
MFLDPTNNAFETDRQHSVHYQKIQVGEILAVHSPFSVPLGPPKAHPLVLPLPRLHPREEEAKAGEAAKGVAKEALKPYFGNTNSHEDGGDARSAGPLVSPAMTVWMASVREGWFNGCLLDRSIGYDKEVEDVSTHSSDKEVGDVSTRSGNVSTHSSVHTPAKVTAETAIPVLAPMRMLAQATTMHKPVIA